MGWQKFWNHCHLSEQQGNICECRSLTCNVDTENKIQPKAIFSNNFELKYDNDMNEELRNLAKQTKEMDNNHMHTDNNIVLNQSLRNQILNNKSINTNFPILTGRSNGNKMIGKIFFSKK